MFVKILKRSVIPKIVFALFLSLTIKSTAFGSWFEVKGGEWEPSSDMVTEIKNKISSYVATHSDTELSIRDIREYSFQYQGKKSNNSRYVYINALCVEPKVEDLNSLMYQVLDGGSCYFNLKYDPERRLFFDLIINGNA